MTQSEILAALHRVAAASNRSDELKQLLGYLAESMNSSTAFDSLVPMQRVADDLGMTKQGLYKNVTLGHIKPVRLGDRLYFTTAEVARFKAARLFSE